MLVQNSHWPFTDELQCLCRFVVDVRYMAARGVTRQPRSVIVRNAGGEHL